MAKSRLADSRESEGVEGVLVFFFIGSGSGRGSLRNERASSTVSLKSAKPQLAWMTSSRSPCSPVAASVLCSIEHKTDYVAVLIMLRS
jgi:hypothetical protein